MGIFGSHMATYSFGHLANFMVGLLLAVPVVAQTQLDLRTQSRNVDFSAAASTRPFKTGSDLPTSCSVGDLFFRSSGSAGKNLYGCTTANIWTVQSDVISPAGVSNYVLPFTNQTGLTVNAAMHGFDSPNLLVSCFDAATPANLIQPASVTINSSTFQVSIQFSSARTGRCVLNAPGTAYLSGEGLVQSGPEFSVDVATVPSFLRSQVDLTSWTIAASSCAAKNIPLVGAALLDAVVPGWPADLDPKLSGTMLVSAAGEVNIRLCNASADPVAVPARTFGIVVLKSF